VPRPRSSNRRMRAVVPENKPARLSFYLAVYRASPLERIAMIRHGLRTCDAQRVIDDLALDRDTVTELLDLTQLPRSRRASHNDALSPAGSERLIGLARLVGQLQEMLQEGGGTEPLDAAAWLSHWLREPLPALAGARPIELIGTMEGQTVISAFLAQLQSCVYA
jgi:putative toxin-antitoxin system antitoxin component (TIGR02293 family)